MIKRKERYYTNLEELRKKKESLGVRWQDVADKCDVEYWKLRKIIDLGYILDKEVHEKVNDWMNSTELDEDIKISSIEKKKREFEKLFEEQKQKIEKEKQKEYLFNQKYIEDFQIVNYVYKPVFSKANFKRLDKDADLTRIDDFYYRFGKQISKNGNIISSSKTTKLRSVRITTLTRYVLQHYFDKGIIEAFERVDAKKINDFLEVRKLIICHK